MTDTINFNGYIAYLRTIMIELNETAQFYEIGGQTGVAAQARDRALELESWIFRATHFGTAATTEEVKARRMAAATEWRTMFPRPTAMKASEFSPAMRKAHNIVDAYDHPCSHGHLRCSDIPHGACSDENQ